MSEDATLTAFARRVADLERAYDHGPRQRYDDLVQDVLEDLRAMPEPLRASAQAELEAAHGRITVRGQVARLADLLPAARQRATRTLADGWDVVELELPDGERVAVVAAPLPPAGLSGEDAAVLRDARTAALTGRCPRCDGAFAASASGQVEVAHAQSCRATTGRVQRVLRRLPS